MDLKEILYWRDTDELQVSIDSDFPFMDYQKLAIQYHYKVKRSLNAFKTGDGKTIVSLGLIKLLMQERKNLSVLVITQEALIHQWKAEIENMLDISILIPNGNSRARKSCYRTFDFFGGHKIMLMSYKKLPVDFDELGKFDVIISDESTILKDPNTQTHKLFKSLIKTTEYVLMLTATPVTLSLEDIYWYISLLYPNYFSSFEEEVGQYLQYKGPFATVVGAENFKPFIDKVSPFIYTRSNRKVSFSFKTVQLDINAEQLRCFNDIKMNANRARKMNKFNPLVFANQFVLCSTCPSLVDNITYRRTSPKVDYLVNTIKNSNGKSLVFARYVDTVSLIREELNKAGLQAISLTGEDSFDRRAEAVYEFNTFSEVKCLILSDMGKFGLNLQAAENIFVMDVPHSPADLIQYIGRLLRPGQENQVKAYFVYMRNTIEEERLLDFLSRQKVSRELNNNIFFDISFERYEGYKASPYEKDYSLFVR